MKYQVKVTGEAALGLPEQDFELNAATGDDAVDAARSKLEKLMPAEGGKLDVEVSCMESWEQVAKTPRGGIVRETIPAGVVSTFSVEFEPQEHVRAAVLEKRAQAQRDAEKAAERKAIEMELIAKLKSEGKLAMDVEVG